MSKIRPFLKWAGGKYALLDKILPMLPAGKCLIEPFAGAGAVFLNSHYGRYLIADTNADLIAVFKALKKNSAAYIACTQKYFTGMYNTKSHYLKLRSEFNQSDDPWRRAQLFLYLNRHGYNGLCRYNSKGVYNVPFGSYKKPIFAKQSLAYFAQKARKARFIHQDFRKTFSMATPGDVIYCDPPYVPLTASANFTDYAKGGFSLADQQDLVTCANAAMAQGIVVLISNHDIPLTRELYQDAEIHSFPVCRTISCNIDNRKPAMELLARFAST